MSTLVEMISADTRVVRSEGIAVADLDGEMIVLDTESGQYYGLNEVGARILQLVEEPRRVSDVVASLQEEYDVDHDRLEQDSLEFLTELHQHEMVHVREEVVS